MRQQNQRRQLPKALITAPDRTHLNSTQLVESDREL